MGSVTGINIEPVVERYCDECEHFEGRNVGYNAVQCDEATLHLKEDGYPGQAMVMWNSDASKCPCFEGNRAYEQRMYDEQHPAKKNRVYEVA